VVSALILIIFTVAGNDMAIREMPERIVSKAAHISLILVATQARNSLINFIIV
jgi:hypothetical protein